MEEYNIEDVLKNIFDSKDANWKPSDKIPLISTELELLKTDLITFLNNTEYDITAILEESQKLVEETKCLSKDMESYSLEIEQETMVEILRSIKNRDGLFQQLQLTNFALSITYDVLQCGKLVKDFDDGREAQSYTRAVEAVSDLLQYLQVPTEGFQNLDIYGNTKHTAQLIMDNLLNDLCGEWGRMITWTSKPGTPNSVITIILNIDDSPTTIDVLNALFISKTLKNKVSEFAQFLLKDVFVAILNNECTVFDETKELMTITIIHKENYKPPYDSVIANLRILISYLSNKLNVIFRSPATIMKMIGCEIREDFKDILVKDCLIDTIPNNINELQRYGRITSEIESFQNFLAVVKFADEGFSILGYVDNIDVLFAGKSSQHFLETARGIMLIDLSTTIPIGVESIPETKAAADLPNENPEAMSILDKTIPNSLFFFPKCKISKSVQELLDLVYMMMEQAVQCSDVVCKKIYNTTRLVFELYDAVVPYHHEDYLQALPQYVAVFHNNCMYLAHNLQTLGDKWLTLMEGRELDYPISFVDLVQKLRDLGFKHLTVHMQQQRKQILDTVRSSDLNCIVVKDVLSKNAEAAVRQCLRQLHLVKNVWIGVLPNNVYTRLMATLVDMFVDELIHRVCIVEDISMEVASQLTEIYMNVIQKAPRLFLYPTDAETFVKSWIKLRELIHILGGTLMDIDRHWQNGNGPMAIHFRPDELRNLIKALFQNTHMRANFLMKLK